MATTSYTEYPTVPVYRTFLWSGIFAGTFLFLAIEATFGLLAVAIFGSPAHVAAGISMGPGIWMIVLSIIALYFASKLSARLAGATTRNLGMYAGLVTFGMSIFTTVLITAMMLGVGSATGFSPARMAHFLATGGWWLFVTFVLAMIAAASGGIHGSWSSRSTSGTTTGTTTRTATTPEERRAA